MAFIADKPKGRHKIRVRRTPASRKGGPPDGSVVEILNDDMPFLVDSVLGELQARGIAVRFLFHPIFKTERDKAGRLQTIAGAGDENWSDGHQESYIAIHLRALSETDARDLTAALSDILAEVRVVVADWRPMLQRLEAGRKQLELAQANLHERGAGRGNRVPAVARAGQLHVPRRARLRAHGRARDAATSRRWRAAASACCAIAGVQVLRRGSELVAMTPEVRRFFFAPAPLIITKANVTSRVHRRVHMDYIGIKTYHADGKPKGEIRFVGLFTSQAYVSSPSQIPSAAPQGRDRAGGAPATRRPATPARRCSTSWTPSRATSCSRSAPRSCRPGARASSTWRRGPACACSRASTASTASSRRCSTCRATATIPACASASATSCRQAYDGRIAAFYPYFPDGPLVRVQFIVARFAGPTPPADVADWSAASSRSCAPGRTVWPTPFCTQGERADALLAKYGTAFSAGYAETFPAERALEDIKRIERLVPEHPVVIDFYRVPGMPASRIHAAVYSLGAPIPLSERVPVLENLGFSAIDERSYHIRPRFADGERDVALHDMVLETSDGTPHRARASRQAAGGVLPRRAARRGRQRRLQPADRVGRRRVARGGDAARLRRLSAPARLAVRPALPRRHAHPPRRASRAT